MYGINHTYTYDASGNITKELYGNITRTYHYDVYNRLVRYNDSGLGSTYIYAYDSRGNILNVTRFAYTPQESNVTSSALETDSYAYNDSEWADVLTSYNGATLTYDDAANPLTWTKGRTLTWVNGKRLASISDGTNTTTYTYNGDGLRTKKVTGSKSTEYYILDGNTWEKRLSSTVIHT